MQTKSLSLTEYQISGQLKKYYQSGVIASMDGYSELYEHVTLKCAAVLVPLAWWKNEWQLVFTRRTETVEHHKGQVSFPGGGCEMDEATPEATALREANEEIGLAPEDVRLLGRMNDIITITKYRVTPIVGVIPWPYQFRPEPGEVGRIFTIPFLWLADSSNWDEQPTTPPGGIRSFPVIRYHPYDGEILWGASARIILNLLRTVMDKES
ncbi:MAG: CoA pyrophosphatase [Anaerolineales bacterium]|jgi:8-oxo-dGTP pyrophosphatase MutT (NUDIX family)